ncbi:MAG TPA: DUF4129 domain-containing protein, partial [Stellaceae bacterium]|nr:DUF4129 domain-containing protein [Stellaceae bacterium]
AASLLAPALAIAAGAAAAATRDEIARATRATIAGLDLQLDLPREPEPASWHLTLPPELLWGVAILGGLLVLYFFLREIIPGLRRSPRDAGWHDGDAESGGATVPEAVAIAADELARQGRFAEAMHLLLFEALAAMRRRDQVFAESLTSREILRRVRLSEAGSASLRDIVARVEWSYFGEHPAGAEDYRHCRDSFDRLAAALQGVSAA